MYVGKYFWNNIPLTIKDKPTKRMLNSVFEIHVLAIDICTSANISLISVKLQ